MKIRLLLGLVLAGALFAVVGATASAGSAPLTNAKHFFWAAGNSPTASSTDQLQNDLIYHGGNVGPGAIGVEQKPAVYLIWWGPQWKAGFTTPDTDGVMYSSKTLQTYLASFFQNVGGSPWAARPSTARMPLRARRTVPAAAGSSQTRRAS